MRGMVGNEQAQAIIDRAIATGQERHAYLLYGPEGVGKTTFATAAAMALLCQRRAPGSAEPCGECAACHKVAAGSHPDLTLVEPADGKRWLSVELIREMIRMVNLAPTEGVRRVFIIPEAERIQDRYVHTLLKTLEEPPEGVTIFLLATDPENILPTIISRCQTIPLREVPPEQIAQALRERWGAPADEAERLAGLARGRLGWAVHARQRPADLEERADLLRRITGLVRAPVDERMRAAGGLGADNASARRALEQWIFWWRDVTLAAHGSQRLLSTGEPRDVALWFGSGIGPDAALRFLDQLLSAQASMDINANPRLTLENLALDMPTVSRTGARTRK